MTNPIGEGPAVSLPKDATPVGTRAMRGTAVTLAGQWTKFVIQVSSLAVLARLLTPNDYGLVTMVTAIVGIATVFGDFGLSQAAIQARALHRSQKNNLFWLNLGIGTVVGAFVFLLASPISDYYHQPSVTRIVQVLSVTFALNGASTQFKAELTRSMKFVSLALMDATSQLVAFVVAIVAASLQFGYWSLVAQQMTVAATSLAFAAFAAGWWPGRPVRAERMRHLISFGANTMGVQAVTYVSSNVDNVLVGRYWGPSVLGIYGRAYNLFELPVAQLAAPLTRVVLPILSRVDDEERYLRYLARIQLMLSYGLVGAFMVVASIAQPLIAIVLGPAWHAVGPIFQVLALGGVFQGLGYMYYWIFLSKGATGIQLRYSVAGRLIMVALIYIGARHSAFCAALGAAAGLAVIWMMYSLFAIPRAGIKIGHINRDAVRVVLSLGVMLCLAQIVFRLFMTGWNPLLSLIACLCVDAAVISGFAIFPATRRDLKAVAVTLRLAFPTSGSSKVGRHRVKQAKA